MAPTGLVGSVLGAFATQWIDPTLLLLATAGLLGWQSIGIIRARSPLGADREAIERTTAREVYAAIGFAGRRRVRAARDRGRPGDGPPCWPAGAGCR
jgi:uncharacterized membrane protein YfcA